MCKKGHSILHTPIYKGNPVNHRPSLRKLFDRDCCSFIKYTIIYSYSKSYEEIL